MRIGGLALLQAHIHPLRLKAVDLGHLILPG
jgi:hypothetical protein